MAYIGAEPLPGQNREVDDISSGFNGNTTAFTLQVSSVNVSPESANNILISLGGIIQNPGTDYTIAASTITFTTAPDAGLGFFGLLLGAGINTATVADSTITGAKVSYPLTLTGAVNLNGETKVDSTLFINSGSGSLQALRFHNDVTGTGINDGASITYSTNSHGLFVSCPETAGNMVFQTGGSQMNNRTLLISNSGVVTLQRNQEPMLVATPNAGVASYHDNVKKLETTSSGITVTGTVTETSDIAFKSDIEPITNTLDKLQQITGYKYKLDNSSINSMGVIAQDVEKVFPDLVHGDEGSKTLQYSGLIGVLVEAVKELSAKVAVLEAS
tara:strand:+ start:4401 stop:5390 length:990 start_codon:yes stop_codon:yes gene_type:complete